MWLSKCTCSWTDNINNTCRDSHDPTLYRVKRYDKSKQWLKSSPKPIKESPGSVSPGTSPWKKPLRNSLALESGQVQDLLHGAVSGVVGNFVGITRAVRQRILPDKQLLEVCITL